MDDPHIIIGMDPARPGGDRTAFVFMSVPAGPRRDMSRYELLWVEDPDEPLDMVRGADGVWRMQGATIGS